MKRIIVSALLVFIIICALPAFAVDTDSASKNVVVVGDIISIPDICEFTIAEAKFTKKVVPSNASSYYTYYEADKGKSYFVVIGEYLNLEAETVSVSGFLDDIVDCELFYAGKYKYNDFAVVEYDLMGMGNSLQSAIMTSIDPLCSQKIFYLMEVPEIVETSEESVVVTIEIEGQTYQLNYR